MLSRSFYLRFVMVFLKKILNVAVALSLLSSAAATMEQGPWFSLWGKVADFTFACSYWTLKPQISIPALQKFTVCLNVKLQIRGSSPWTAFMYRHPEFQFAELGLGGKWNRLVVWLFGVEWMSPKIELDLLQWHALCITWSHTKDRPALYVNGDPVVLSTAHDVVTAPSKLVPGGSLTLGASHMLVNGNIQIIPLSRMEGKLSLFRIWGRERSRQEVTSLSCTEGDQVKWETDNWDTQICAPLKDHSLQCEWSIYEVRLMFAIIRHDGNDTELYKARDIAHNWLETVLPTGIYLHRVSVFDVSRSTAGNIVNTSSEHKAVWWSNPNINRFHCLVHVSVIPSLDVAAVQREMYIDLKDPHNDPSGLLQLLADAENIHTTPIESFTDAAITPSTVVTRTPSVTSTTTTLPSTTTSTTTFPSTTTSTTTLPSTTTSTTTLPSTTSTTTLPSTTTSTSTLPSTTTTTTTLPSTTTSTTTTLPSTTTTTTTLPSTTNSTTTSTTTLPSTTTTTTTLPSTTTSNTTLPSTTTSTTTLPSTTISTTTLPSTTTSTTTTLPSTTTTTIKTPDTSTITSVSTSEASASTFATSSANISELYFEVKMNVSITGGSDTEQILSTWLNSSLPDDLMMVLDLQLLPRVERHYPNLQSDFLASDEVFIHKVSRESCIFQIQVMKLFSDTQEMEQKIRQILQTPYNNGSVSIETTEDIQISRILNFKCSAETRQTRKGLFVWPDTSGGKTITHTCPKTPHRNATRHCKLCLSTYWMDPDLEDCPLVVETIPDLDHVEVTAGNSLDVVEMIEDLLRNHSMLNYKELVTVLKKLEDIVNLSEVTPNLGQALINIISDILESDSYLVPFTNTILNITEAVGDRMVGYVGSSTLVAPGIGISVVDVLPGQFSRLTFGVSSDGAGTKPEIFINKNPLNGTVAFISLPSVLQQSFPQEGLNQNPPRILFQFYGIRVLFKGSQKGQTLNTFVVSASVTNASSPIKDLTEDIKVTLKHLVPNTHHKDVQCVYWNFNKNNGHGGWDDYGCQKNTGSTLDYTTCLCDHLTHFGVLLDVSRTQVDQANEQILTIITYVGCGVSSLFLGITVLTYTAFEKLRRDYPSQILINLSLALLGLNLVFLVNSWLASWGVYGLCVAAASMLHYFLLASFTWMGLEAVNMYFALVKVFNVYVPSYILKFCALGWGLPLVICVLVLIVNREAYGSHLYTDSQSTLEPLDNSDNFCWLQDDVTFYVSVVSYAVLVFLFNIGVFVVVLIQIRKMRVNRPVGIRSGLLNDLKGVASLTLLLGLTWTVGFFTWGPARIVLLYLFSGLNTLQGLFIFLFHCLMKENVRKQWRIHLCFGRFRLEEYSEWSNSASVGGLAKPKTNPPGPSVPSVRSVKSSSTDSTSASSDSSQRDSSYKRPNLGLFVNSLALPQAQRSLSSTGCLPSYRGMNQNPGWRNHLLD